MSRRVRGPGRGPLESGAVGIDWFLLVSSAARGKKKQGQSLLSLCFISRTTRKEKKTLPLPGPFHASAHLSSPRARSSHLTHKLARGAKRKTKTIFALPDRVSGGKDTGKPLVHATIFLLLSLGKKNLGGREQTKEAKRTHTYLDTLGSRNPPGASPDTTNRSSRPRLSTEYRRCPELRSLTRTPYKIRAKKKYGYVYNVNSRERSLFFFPVLLKNGLSLSSSSSSSLPKGKSFSTTMYKKRPTKSAEGVSFWTRVERR